MRELQLIAAFDEQRALGLDGDLPWRLPEDLRRFKLLTWGHAVLMGRRTFSSLPRPLPGRRNLVISRTLAARPGVEICATLDEALHLAGERAFIIGGAQLYKAALPYCTWLHLTRVKGTHAADTFFPGFNEADFYLMARVRAGGDEECCFETWRRRGI